MLKDPRQYSKYAEKHGYTKDKGSRWAFLESIGCKKIVDWDRNRWVWFDGPRKKALEAACLYKFLPYPKRALTPVV